MVNSKTHYPLTDKALMLEGLFRVLFGKVLDQAPHHLISKPSGHGTVEPPAWPIQHKVEEEKVLIDSRDIKDQRPP